MKLKILLIGKNGQVGSELALALPRLGSLISLDRRQLDLAKPGDIRRAIRESAPQFIVNAAAYTAVDQAEKDELSSRAINTDAPAVMAEEAKKIGSVLVHYSTDYVFDGTKNSPYVESDPTNPVNVYGKTKLAGEQAIRDSGATHLIFRTAWVYATSGRNFLLTMLRLGTQREELRVVRDQIGAPTWSREIARATTEALARLRTDSGEGMSPAAVSGTHHLTAAGATSWHEFATVIFEEASRTPKNTPWFAKATSGNPFIFQRVVPVTTAEFPTPARRPANSVLSNARLLRAFGIQLPDWRSQLHSAFTAG